MKIYVVTELTHDGHSRPLSAFSTRGAANAQVTLLDVKRSEKETALVCADITELELDVAAVLESDEESDQ